MTIAIRRQEPRNGDIGRRADLDKARQIAEAMGVQLSPEYGQNTTIEGRGIQLPVGRRKHREPKPGHVKIVRRVILTRKNPWGCAQAIGRQCGLDYADSSAACWALVELGEVVARHEGHTYRFRSVDRGPKL